MRGLQLSAGLRLAFCTNTCAGLSGYWVIHAQLALFRSGFCNGMASATDQFERNSNIMLGWTLMFLLISIVAGVLGFTGIAGTAAGIAQILFVIFLVLFLASFVSHLLRSR
jgi:uncharacterized membrane protein YtjA (UPF0391 family)